MDEHILIEISLLITTALACGMAFEWFGQPSILGYILTGIILGPTGIALVDDKSYITILAEFGVQMLLYVIGMELSLVQFRKVWKPAGSVAILQIGGTFAVIKTLGYVLHWSNGYVFALTTAIALSSTAVAIQLLKRIHQLHSEAGRLTVGILIAQDLLVIPIIIMLRHYNQDVFSINIFIKFIVPIVILLALTNFLKDGKLLHIPFLRTLIKNPELSALASVFFCFGCASLSGISGFSPAYGAFLGGLIVGNTEQKESLLHYVHPLQSLFLAAFFVSVGLLIDINFIGQHLIKIICLMLVIFVCKTVLNMVILRLLKQDWKVSFLSGVSLSQMGEFGFLITSLAFDEHLIDSHGKQLILTLVVLSLVASPFWLKSIKKIRTIKFSGGDFHELINKVYDEDFTFVCRAKALLKGFRKFSWVHKNTKPNQIEPMISHPTYSTSSDDQQI